VIRDAKVYAITVEDLKDKEITQYRVIQILKSLIHTVGFEGLESAWAMISSTVQFGKDRMGEVKGNSNSTSFRLPLIAASCIGLVPHCHVTEETNSNHTIQ
jgi:hypothetical protein